MNNSVKSYGGLIEEIAADTKMPDPSEILMALEERFLEKGPDPMSKVTHEFQHNWVSKGQHYLDMYVQMVLQAHFGQWIPPHALSKVEEAFKWVDEEYEGNPVEGKMAAMLHVIDQIKGVEDWKNHMKLVKLAGMHDDLKDRYKRNGWQMNVYQFPPFLHKFVQVDKDGNPVLDQSGKRVYRAMKENQSQSFLKTEAELGRNWQRMSNTSMHEQAFYRLNLPNHKADLSKDLLNMPSAFRTNENQAAQTLAKRLGINDFRGGAHSLVEKLMGEGYTASFTTYRENGCWFVEIGAEKTKQSTLSSFWLVNGELTQDNPNKDVKTGFEIAPDHPSYTPQLTLSQLESQMSLLAHAKDLGIENADGEIVDYMNEEEEFLSLPPARDRDSEFIDFRQFAEDDLELKCLYYLRGKIGDGFGLTMGDLQSQEAEDLVYGTLDYEVTEKEDGSIRRETRWRGGLYGAQESLKRVTYAYEQNPNDELLAVIENLQRLCLFYKEVADSLNLLRNERYNVAVSKHSKKEIYDPVFDPTVYDRKWMPWYPQGEKPVKPPTIIKDARKPYKPRYEARRTPERVTAKMIWDNGRYKPVKVVIPEKIEYTTPYNASPRLRALLKGLQSR